MTDSPRKCIPNKGFSMTISKFFCIVLAFVFPMVLIAIFRQDLHGPMVYSTIPSAMEIPDATTSPDALPLQPPIQRLVESLRNAIHKVEQNTGLNSDISSDDLEVWRRNNPCMSRRELIPLYSRLSSPHRKPLPQSDWKLVLHEYAKLHSLCTRAAGNVTSYFTARNMSTGCKFMVANCETGMGNKILVMAPAVLYAILTQRVILLPVSNGVPDILCEPFAGSSWRLDTNVVHDDSLWNQSYEFLANVDRAKQEHESILPMYAARTDDNWQPISRFFCDVEQMYFGQVPWLVVQGCLYFLPKLFAIPSFRPTLEALFPDPTLTLTHILRTTFLPRDKIWARVRSAEQLYTDGAHSQLGIQARYFNNSEAKHKVVNANVEGCIVEKNLLDLAIPTEQTTLHHQTTIFVTSLTSDLQEHLRSVYNRSTTSFPDLNFQQLSSESEQRFGPDVYEQVLVEVLWLSLSHTLLVSGKSTFGGLAQAYGALTPWIIEARDEVRTPCQYAQTVDNCYQMPEKGYRCPYDSNEKMWTSIGEVTPYIKDCLAVDVDGLQLVHNASQTLR